MTPRSTTGSLLLACGLYLAAMPAVHAACGIDMRDYIQLRIGMTEGEVLYRVGPPDHETVVTDAFGAVSKRVWYYLPDRCGSSNRWISEITLDRNGRVRARDRYKP